MAIKQSSNEGTRKGSFIFTVSLTRSSPREYGVAVLLQLLLQHCNIIVRLYSQASFRVKRLSRSESFSPLLRTSSSSSRIRRSGSTSPSWVFLSLLIGGCLARESMGSSSSLSFCLGMWAVSNVFSLFMTPFPRGVPSLVGVFVMSQRSGVPRKIRLMTRVTAILVEREPLVNY